MGGAVGIESVPLNRSTLEALRARDPRARSYDEIIAELLCYDPPKPFVRHLEKRVRRAKTARSVDTETALRARNL